MLRPSDPVTSIPFIGPVQAKKLARLQIKRVVDLLLHIPVRYVDSRETTKIKDARVLPSSTIIGRVVSIGNSFTRNRKVITKAVISDDTGSINLIWFNQRFIIKSIYPGKSYLFQIKQPKNGGDFYVTTFEELKSVGEQLHLGRISPVYKQTAGLSTKWLRSRLKDSLKGLDLTEITTHTGGTLKQLAESLQSIHFPEGMEQLKDSIKPLQFDEMLGLAYDIKERKALIQRYPGVTIPFRTDKFDMIKSTLPYSLTDDQEQAVLEILSDMSSSTPMHRLINGDVGSGKTIVAMIATSMVLEAGYKVIFLAPTTILAKQHYETLIANPKIVGKKIGLVTSDESIYDEPNIIVGTHALFYRDDLPSETALVVIDEQHRFGVEQRKLLREMVGGNFQPHYLSLSATPIPRTLARIIFGDMEVSTIASPPASRMKVESHYVPLLKRNACYEWIRDEIQKSSIQAFIVLPLIETSEELSRELSVLKIHKELSEGVFSSLRVEYMHGRLSEREKIERMSLFSKGQIDVLISTTVIEVGIDIPNANIILIEGAERFGLAQLHQLRGRVGRGAKQGYCYVIPTDDIPDERAVDRLNYFVKHSSGFDIAEFDLTDRGPGQITGSDQSGLPDLILADLSDLKMLQKAKTVADELPSRPFTIFELKKSLD